MRICLLVVFLVVAGRAGTDPRAKPSDYPVHAAAGDVTVAAEYMVHSFGARGQNFIAEGYLTVEVALYPKPGVPVDVNAGRFTLRINGRKRAILPQAPGMVAGSLKYPDWERRPGVVASAGVGDAAVILGRPRTVERFPGDPRPGQERLPSPPRAPDPENRSGLDRPDPVKPEELVVEVALSEGVARGPAAGFLYFASKDKPGRIRSLELLYQGAVLQLK